MTTAGMRSQLQSLPERPGVYMFEDGSGEVIYVGKAKSLKSRLRSYFNSSGRRYKSRLIQQEAEDFDYLITENEVEAYILEANLIKKYGPRYNIQLKDDKTYPYIKVTVQEDYPRILKSRMVREDGARYYGPYADVGAVYRVMNTVKDLFKLRRCSGELDAAAERNGPCLNYHIDKCRAPCQGKIGRSRYRAQIENICRFLAGYQDDLLAQVEERMQKAAADRNFERAADFRDGLQALKKLTRQQKVASGSSHNLDVIGLVREEEADMACAQLLFVRNGSLVGQDYVILRGVAGEAPGEIAASFLPRFYAGSSDIPPQILLSSLPEKVGMLEKSLKKRREGGRVELKMPRRGEKSRLVEMAEENARQNLKKNAIKRRYQEEKSARELQQLQEELELEKKPFHIEGFDVSNLKTSDSVASLVVFKGGNPSKEMYRRFRIKSVSGQDDYAMMQEVIERRYTRLLEEDRKLPDLILIDGGRGQLNAAVEVLDELGLQNLNIVSLAKQDEEIYIPAEESPLKLPGNSPGLQLLQRVRNEAHRFAVNYHRKLRSRRLTESMLDQIRGIGPARRKKLLQHFGSLGQIRNATPDDLQEVEGISDELAARVYEYLQEHTRQV